MNRMRTATGTLVIDNGQLIDGTGASPVQCAALHITDGVIAYAGPATSAPSVTLVSVLGESMMAVGIAHLPRRVSWPVRAGCLLVTSVTC